MSIPSLISDEALDDLPIEPEAKFYELVRAAQASLARVLADPARQGTLSPLQWRHQFIHEVTGAASELGVGGLPTVATALQSTGTMDDFDATLTRMLTRYRIRYLPQRRVDTVALSAITKESLRSDLENLRQRVNDANLSAALKESLHQRINDVEAELDKKRSRLGPMWLLAGAVGLIPPVVSVAADAPNARDHIVAGVTSLASLFQSEKQAEDREEARLTGQTLALPHTPVKALTDQTSSREVTSTGLTSSR